MTVMRIVANVATPDPARARAFYRDLLGLEVLMDHGWLVTYGADTPKMNNEYAFVIIFYSSIAAGIVAALVWRPKRRPS